MRKLVVSLHQQKKRTMKKITLIIALVLSTFIAFSQSTTLINSGTTGCFTEISLHDPITDKTFFVVNKSGLDEIWVVKDKQITNTISPSSSDSIFNIAISGNKLFAFCVEQDSKILVIDINTELITNTITLPSGSFNKNTPTSCIVSGKLYITGYNNVIVVDLSTFTVSYVTISNPWFASIATNNSLVYVVTSESNIYEINTNTNAVIGTYNTGVDQNELSGLPPVVINDKIYFPRSSSIAIFDCINKNTTSITGYSNRLIETNGKILSFGGSVSVIDPQSNSIIKTIDAISDFPICATLRNNTIFIFYIANTIGDDNVVLLDATTFEIIDSITTPTATTCSITNDGSILAGTYYPTNGVFYFNDQVTLINTPEYDKKSSGTEVVTDMTPYAGYTIYNNSGSIVTNFTTGLYHILIGNNIKNIYYYAN